MTEKDSKDYSVDQMAVGFALGAALGLTPLFSLHNLVLLGVPTVLRLSIRTFLVAWIAAIPIGFLLDPFFQRLGSALLSSELLTPLWIWAASAPLVPLTRFNNTVTLGSLVFWAASAVPLFLLARRAVASYRAGWERLLISIPVIGSMGRLGFVRRLLGLEARHRGWIRKGFVFPLGLFLGVGIGTWWLFADRSVHAGVERAGTRIIGATVDVGAADVDLSDAMFTITGLEVTNPSAPQNNVVEVDEIAASVSRGPLMRAKIAVDSVVIRDIRFNSPRETPGVVDTERERSTVFRDEMARWRASTRIPDVPALDLSSPIDFGRLSPDSLATVIRARELAATVSTAQASLANRTDALDVAEQIDSASTLLASLEGASFRTLGPTRAARTLDALRSMARAISETATSVSDLEENLRREVTRQRQGLLALNDLRAEDYRRALGVLDLPSFDPDDVSAAILQAPLMERVETLLYWARLVDANFPEGSESVRFEGPERLRSAGEDVRFPSVRAPLPTFAVDKLRGSATMGALTDVVIDVNDLSSDPRVTGRPVTVRLSGENGTARATLDLSFDRTGIVAEDRLTAQLTGLPLPSLEISALGARLDLGDGATRIDLSRSGNEILGGVTWSATSALWQRTTPEAEGAAGYLWDLVSRLTSVEITLELDGALSSPGISVRSNIGERIVQALRDQIGDEVRLAEERVQAEVDRLIDQSVNVALDRIADLEDNLGGTLSQYGNELDRLKTSVETRLRELTPGLPNIPGLPG